MHAAEVVVREVQGHGGRVRGATRFIDMQLRSDLNLSARGRSSLATGQRGSPPVTRLLPEPGHRRF
jgi:hypothetical protein